MGDNHETTNNKDEHKIIHDSIPGYYGFGKNLYLRISKEKTAFWIFRYTFGDKRREYSIGYCSNISLNSAIKKAEQLKINVRDGIDPLKLYKGK